MKYIKKIAPLSMLVILGLCLFGILFVVFDRAIYTWWVSLVVPKPHIFQVDISRRTAIQVYPNAEGIEWFGTTWTDDGKYIEINNSRGQVYASKLMVIDPENVVYPNKIQTLEKGNILGLVNELPFKLESREALWAGCEKENFFFTAKYLDNKNGFWETRLWKGSQLIKTFQPIAFFFGMYQSGFNDDPVGWTIEYSHFSPDCRYDIISFGKDVWLLDTVEKSFLRIFEARQFKDNLNDILEGHYQFIWPSWAPNSHEFVFGDYEYGLEKYDIASKQRSWIVAPGITGGIPTWSKTGKWILGDSVVISADGSNIGTLEGCETIENPSWSSNKIDTSTENPSWSPTDDKFAFTCSKYDQSTQKREIFLIIWDLSNLDGN
jgi:hypothetical protein